MTAFSVPIDTTPLEVGLRSARRLRNGLQDRRRLHAKLSVDLTDHTAAFVRALKRHKTAASLGAKPTGHHADSAKRLEAAHNAEAAMIRVPRDTGLQRAFGDIHILPGSGKQFLARPGVKETYGTQPAEYAPGVLSFTVIGGRYPALVFTETWSLAFWLMREVTQKQDRSLLPTDAAYRGWARNSGGEWMRDEFQPREDLT